MSDLNINGRDQNIESDMSDVANGSGASAETGKNDRAPSDGGESFRDLWNSAGGGDISENEYAADDEYIDEDGEEEEEGDDEEVSFPSLIFDIVETLAVAACAIVILFVTVFRVAMVSGSSMNNTLFNKDVLIVSDLGFKPRTGDIVVFQKLNSSLSDMENGDALVKRVIATEGQTIDIDFDTWTVTVDGKVLDESEYRYLAPDAIRRSDFSFPITLGEGEVFVMGDNRNHSTDSRSSAIGIVDERTIFGRVIMRISPISDFRIFGRSKDAR